MKPEPKNRKLPETSPRSEIEGSGKADHIIARVEKRSELFCDPSDKLAYAKIKRDEYHDVYVIDSEDFREWLRALYYREARAAMPTNALETAVATLVPTIRSD